MAPPQITSVPGQVTSRSAAADGKPKSDRVYTPEEQRRIERVKKIMFDMAKTVRSFTLYNQNNDTIRQFMENLFESLVGFLKEEGGVLTLRVRPEQLLFDEAVVYENSNREESVAIKLYKDGVKELIFHNGLEKRELVDLIDILNKNLDQPEFFDTDVVSLMWERDFDHITYFVIEGFSDKLDPERREKIEEDIEMILSLVHSDKPPERILKSARLSKDDLYQYFTQDSLDQAATENFQEKDAFKSHFLVEEHEIRKLRADIAGVSDSEMIFELVEIVLNILAKETDHDSFMTIGDVLIQIIDTMLLRSDFANATRIIKRLREIVIRGGGSKTADDRDGVELQGNLVDPQMNADVRLGRWIEEIIEKIGQEQRLEQLVAALNQGFKGKPATIFDYIVSLNSSAVNPLINLLGEVSNLTHRRLICDAILIIHDGDISSFSRKLYDERWFVVSDMLYLLGKVGNADALMYMKKAYEHENPKVRVEAIGSLKRFPIDRVRDVFISALQDANLQVQMEALRTLAHHKDHGAVEQILTTIESQEFNDFPLSVKKRFFMTLAMIEKQRFLPYFQKALTKNRFWLGAINTDFRVCAAMALGMLATPESTKLLEKYKNAWNRPLRDACREALGRGRGGGNIAAMDGGGDGGGLILEPMAQKTPSSGGLILEPMPMPASQKAPTPQAKPKR